MITHQIKTDVFEGPLELLLDLIEKQKLSINHVSLAAIADTYVAEVKSRATYAPREVAQFLVVASTLMLIKSRSLLPNLTVSDEEEANIYDLEDRLEKLRRIRALSRHIAEAASSGKRMYTSGAPALPAMFYPPEGITPNILHGAMKTIVQTLLSFVEKSAALPEKTILHVVSLEEKITELMRRVQQSLTNSFRSFVGSKKEKLEIIISFLALLELVKQGHLLVEQQEQFGDIAMRRN